MAHITVRVFGDGLYEISDEVLDTLAEVGAFDSGLIEGVFPDYNCSADVWPSLMASVREAFAGDGWTYDVAELSGRIES